MLNTLPKFRSKTLMYIKSLPLSLRLKCCLLWDAGELLRV